MHLHPRLRALRSDDAPQRHAQTAAFRATAAWRAQLDVAVVMDDLAAFATSRDMAECPALAALFDAGDPAAGRLAAGFVAQTSALLRQEPLAHVPLRHFVDGTVSTLLLGSAGSASLLLSALDGAAFSRLPPPVSLSFTANETWEHMLEGDAEAELVELRTGGQPASANPVSIHRRAITIRPGRVIGRDGSRQALLLRRVEGRLVSLKLIRRKPGNTPSREYDLASGRLVHQAAGCARDSRHELMVTLLGRMGRADAAPVLAEMAQDIAAAPALRWEALRECLGLDTIAGFRALCTVARSAADPLAAAAGALRAQLLEAHPQLAGVDPCPLS
jgi:hypothetical protein